MEGKPPPDKFAPHYPGPPPPDTNVWGLIGLIMGLLGFFFWIAAPAGLVLSYAGMKHPNNGLAVAGLVVSIVSTIWAAVMLGILLLYFGIYAAICGSCCCMGVMATDRAALEMEVRKEAAQQLGLDTLQVEIKDLLSDSPFSTDVQTFTGKVVYQDENGQQVAQDISGEAEKVDGQWQVNSLRFDSAPYEYIDPFAIEQDPPIDDGAPFEEDPFPSENGQDEHPPEDDVSAEPLAEDDKNIQDDPPAEDDPFPDEDERPGEQP